MSNEASRASLPHKRAARFRRVKSAQIEQPWRQRKRFDVSSQFVPTSTVLILRQMGPEGVVRQRGRKIETLY